MPCAVWLSWCLILRRAILLLDVVRQALVRVVHVGEARVAAGGRHLARKQEGVARRPLDEALVGVPVELAVAVVADGLAVDGHVGHDRHLRRIRDVHVARLAEVRRALEIAEALREPRERDVVELVPAQADDEPVAQCALERADVGGTGRREVDAFDVGTERGGRGTDAGFGEGRGHGGGTGCMRCAKATASARERQRCKAPATLPMQAIGAPMTTLSTSLRGSR